MECYVIWNGEEYILSGVTHPRENVIAFTGWTLLSSNDELLPEIEIGRYYPVHGEEEYSVSLNIVEHFEIIS